MTAKLVMKIILIQKKLQARTIEENTIIIFPDNDHSQYHSTISEDFGASVVPAALLFDRRIRSIPQAIEKWKLQ